MTNPAEPSTLQQEQFLSSAQLNELQQQQEGDLKRQQAREKRKKVLFGIGLGMAGIVGLLYPFVSPAFRGKKALPYVPATNTQIRMIKEQILPKAQASTKPIRFVDLGSGDGRVVLAMAKEGIRSEGIELNFWLVLYSQFRAYATGLHRFATFRRRNLWKTDLSSYDAISLFGVKEMMPMLEKKLSQEMKDDAILVACRFKLPRWTPEYEKEDALGDKGLESVWVYRKQPTPDVEVKEDD